MLTFALGFIGSLVGGLCLSITYTLIFYFERKRVEKETEQIVDKFKRMYLEQNEYKFHSKDDDSRFN